MGYQKRWYLKKLSVLHKERKATSGKIHSDKDIRIRCDLHLIIFFRQQVEDTCKQNSKILANLISFLFMIFTHWILFCFSHSRGDDPFQAIAEVVTSSRVERTVSQLEEDGYKEGPGTSSDVTLCEGDIIEIGFRGNIHHDGDVTLQMPFNSNMPDSLRFTLSEVDCYLQRNFPLFRGFVQFYRKHPIRKKHDSRSKHHQKSDEDEAPPEPEPVHYHRELLTELMVKIPKVGCLPLPTVSSFRTFSI